MSDSEFLDELYASRSSASKSSKSPTKGTSASRPTTATKASLPSTSQASEMQDELESSDSEFPARITSDSPPQKPASKTRVKTEPLSIALSALSNQKGRASTPISISSDEDEEMGNEDAAGEQGNGNGEVEEGEGEAEEEGGEEEEERTGGTTPTATARESDQPKPSAKGKEVAVQSDEDSMLPSVPASKPKIHRLSMPSASQPASRSNASTKLNIQPVAFGSKKTSMLPPASQPTARSTETSIPLPKPMPKERTLSHSQPVSEPGKKKRKLQLSDIQSSPSSAKPTPRHTQPAPQPHPRVSPSASATRHISSQSYESDPSPRRQTSSAAAQVEAMLTSSPGPDDDGNVDASDPEEHSGSIQPPKKRAKTGYLPSSSSQVASALSRSASKASNTAPSVSLGPKARGRKHPKWWLLDGSVVIQVHKTLFRLHRSRLVNNSTFFAALLGDPQSYTGGVVKLYEKATRPNDMDGHPAYKLLSTSGKAVSVEDFEILVEFLEDPYGYLDTPPPFLVLAGLLRGSRALDFGRFDAFATRKLQQMWPPALEDLSTDTIPHASDTVALARRWDMPELLKRAFYELVRSPRLGQELDDDNDNDENESSARDEEDRNIIISRTDLIRLIETREKLHLEWFLCADSPPSAKDYPCPLAAPPAASAEPGRSSPAESEISTATACAAARENFLTRWIEAVKNSGIYEDHMYDPLCGLDKLAEINWEEEGFCEGCVESWRSAWWGKQEKTWENLELWLNLPKVLKDAADDT